MNEVVLNYAARPRRPGTAFHALAVVTTCATFPLIFIGGLVTSNHAGMAVPDWPNSFGYNMFALPWNYWVGGVIYEHVHRLAASVVGMLSMALAFVAWRAEPRRWVRNLAYAVLAAVIFQGVLGGLRVVMNQRDLAMIHGIFGQTFFCLCALTAVVTSRTWREAPDLSAAAEAPAGRWLIRLSTAAVVVLFLQLILGAVMRHSDAGLAIPDVPTSYGRWLPPTHAADLKAILRQPITAPATGDISYPAPVTLGQVWIHFAHRIGAVLVTVTLLSVILVALSLRHRQLRRAAILLLFLLAAQLTLGVLTVLMRKPADIASAHVALGALTLMKTFVLAVRARRVYGRRSPDLRQKFSPARLQTEATSLLIPATPGA